MEVNQVIGALQIENEEVRLMVVQIYAGRFDIIAKETVSCKGINGVRIVDENQVVEAIKTAANNASVKLQSPLKSVLLVIPGYRFKKERKVVDLILDNHVVNYSDVKEAFKEAFKTNVGHDYEIINISCANYKINGITYPKIPLGEKGDLLSCDIDIICGDRLIAYDYANAVVKAGLQVIDLCQDCFCSGKEAALYENSHNRYIINLYLEKSHSVFSLISNGRLVSGFSNEEGYQSFVKAIMNAFNLPYTSAKRLLFRYGEMDNESGDERTIARWQNNGVDKMISFDQLQKAIYPEVNKFVDNINNYCCDIIARENMSMIITGQGAALEGLDRALQNRFNREVSCYCPDKLGVREHQYSALLGMIYAYIDTQTIYGTNKCSVEMGNYKEHLLPADEEKFIQQGMIKNFTDKLFTVDDK